MAIITVDQTTSTGTMAWDPSPYIVQRFRRNGNPTTAEQAAMTQLCADLDCNLYTIHIGGGYQNVASGSVQKWKMRDPMPATATYDYSTVGGFMGLTQFYGYLQDLIDAGQTNAKAMLVMHDFPVPMLGGQTRTSASDFPWPPASEWSKMLALLEDIEATFPGMTYGVGYGQELKGISNRTDTSVGGSLDKFCDGFNTIAPLIRSSGTIGGWKIGFPHLNLWATASLANRATAFDALLGGSDLLQAADETILAFLLAQVDPTNVDFLTLDWSIIDAASPSNPWRPGQGGSYDTTVKTKVHMPYDVMVRARELMQAAWSTTKPIWAIERYVDVNQLEQDWMSEDQMAAANTALSIWFARGGGTWESWWEPHAGTAGSESPTGNIMSWWDTNGVPYKLHGHLKALRQAIARGSQLYAVTSDDPTVVPIVGDDKIYLLNLNSTAVTVTVNATGGSLAPTSIPAYSYLVQTLPMVQDTARDTFTRSVATGWGDADTGGAWTVGTGGTVFNVNGTSGLVVHSAAGNTRRAVLPGVSRRNGEATVTVYTDKIAQGGALEQFLIVRQLDTTENNYYGLDIKYQTNQTIKLAIVRRLSNVQTTISNGGADLTLARETHAANRRFRVRLSINDDGTTTTIAASVWQDGTTEPTAWDIVATDVSASLNAPGYVGVRSYNGGSTNTPNTFGYDDLNYGIAAAEGAVVLTGGGVVTLVGTSADLVPPTIATTSPTNGAINVAVGSNVVVTFSEAMDPATITTASLVVSRNGVPVAGTITMSGGNTIATFNPTVDLLPGTTYAVDIDETVVRDAAGNLLVP